MGMPDTGRTFLYMHHPVRIAMVTLAILPLLSSIPNAVQSAASSRSTAEAVYSDSQASRGRSAYLANCSSGCHGSRLTGGESAPALAGDAFVGRWKGLTLDALFERIRSTMPLTKPQSLSDSTYVDIIAFLLDANGFPGAGSDLVADPAALKQIVISDPNESNRSDSVVPRS